MNIKNKINNKKKGVSPVIATILLILIVIILAIIVLLWARGFVKESLVKTVNGNEKSIETYCNEVSLRSRVDSDSFSLTNNGNIPIFKVQLKISDSSGNTITETIPSINPGRSISPVKDSSGNDLSIAGKKITAIPVLLGRKKGSSNDEEYACIKNSVDII